MALKVEGILNGGMHAREALGGSSRFEPLHLALSSSPRLMLLNDYWPKAVAAVRDFSHGARYPRPRARASPVILTKRS